MKSNEYNAWYRHNDPQDARRDLGAYNKPYKERYERPPEYSAREDAYPHYTEMYNPEDDQDDDEKRKDRNDQQDQSSKNSQAKTRTAQNAARGAVQSVVGNVVAIAVGAIVLVSGYQAMEAAKAQEQPGIPEEKIVEEWHWDGEVEEGGALKILAEDGTVLKEIPIDVTVNETPATCTEDGLKTTTATAVDGDKVYTDTKEEVLPALGHVFDAGTTTVTEHGAAIVKTCERCHEQITVEISIEEMD